MGCTVTDAHTAAMRAASDALGPLHENGHRDPVRVRAAIDAARTAGLAADAATVAADREENGQSGG